MKTLTAISVATAVLAIGYAVDKSAEASRYKKIAKHNRLLFETTTEVWANLEEGVYKSREEALTDFDFKMITGLSEIN